MNYIGSKYSLLKFLDDSINKIVDKDCKIFCDLFAGTGIVGRYFKRKGYSIIANDLQYYSFVLNKQYIENHTILKFNGLMPFMPKIVNVKESERKEYICEYLTHVHGIEGFIFKNYCSGGTKGQKFERLYFTDENGKKCDGIRKTVEDWKNNNLINENEYYFLLTTLLESIDKLANTASVYGAYLKSIKRSAQKELVMKPAEHIINEQKHKVFNEDINTLIGRVKGDILYLDPPYNHRQYAPNYHILETISKYDNPAIKGKTGLRDYSKQKSTYCLKNKVKESFRDLILKANMKYIFLSYNNEGLMSLEEIKEIMSLRGKYGYFTKEYNRFKADKTENRNHKAVGTVEYLHYVIVKN